MPRGGLFFSLQLVPTEPAVFWNNVGVREMSLLPVPRMRRAHPSWNGRSRMPPVVPAPPEIQAQRHARVLAPRGYEKSCSLDDIIELISYHVGLQKHLVRFVEIKWG
jgi:hypothetical protein